MATEARLSWSTSRTRQQMALSSSPHCRRVCCWWFATTALTADSVAACCSGQCCSNDAVALIGNTGLKHGGHGASGGSLIFIAWLYRCGHAFTAFIPARARWRCVVQKSLKPHSRKLNSKLQGIFPYGGNRLVTASDALHVLWQRVVSEWSC